MDNDKLLDLVQSSCDKIMKQVDESEEHAFFAICTRMIETSDGETPQVETYIDAGGYYGILAEGLYAELRSQLENNHPQLFTIIRDVIHDLEEDLEIEPDADLLEDDAPTLH